MKLTDKMTFGISHLSAIVQNDMFIEQEQYTQPRNGKMSQELKTLLSSESNEWYTPQRYTDMAHAVMGRIDLDPASNEQAQQWIKARYYFTIQDNGLHNPWQGRVWLNPPYGKTGQQSNQEIWTHKLIHEYQQDRVSEGIVLLKAAVGYDWFDNILHGEDDQQPLWDAVCLMRGLISFIRGNGSESGKAKLGSVFLYFGPNRQKFEQVFSKTGLVI